MPRVFFLVNPAAGHGRARVVWDRIRPLASNLGPYGVLFTERPRHAEEIARQAAGEGYERIVIVGGDGTINEAGNGIVGTGAAMAVVPTGTANDWVRTFGPVQTPEEAVRSAYEAEPVKVDVGLAVGYRYFFNMAGMGFDAEVARRVNDYGPVIKVFGGTVPTILALLATLVRFGSPRAELRLDDRGVEIPSLLLSAVGVGRFIGGGMMMLPEAVPDDGLFDVLWAKGMGRLSILGLLTKIYSGQHVGHPKVTLDRARRVTLSAAVPLTLHLDGEVVGAAPSISLEIRAGALKAVVPRPSQEPPAEA